MHHIPQIMPDSGEIFSSRIILNTSENCVKHESFLQRLGKSENDNDCGVSFISNNNNPLTNTSMLLKQTESCLFLNGIGNKLNTSQFNRVVLKENKEVDGAVLTNNEDNNFEAANKLSPILKERHMISNEIYMEEEYEELFPNESLFDDEKGSAKRKRPNDESFDISMKSTESFATSKKPKLIRTGSITKNLRRSISFAAMKTPINTIFRLGRNINEKNYSFTSQNSNESPFNDSFRAVKSKMRHIKNKISKLNKKGIETPNSAKTKIIIASEDLVLLKKENKKKSAKGLMSSIRTPEKYKNDSSIMEFKTPIAPRQSTSTSKSFSRDQTFQKLFNPNQTKSQSSYKGSSPSKTDNTSHKKTNPSVIQSNVTAHVELTHSCMLNMFPVAELSPVFNKNLKMQCKMYANLCLSIHYLQ